MQSPLLVCLGRLPAMNLLLIFAKPSDTNVAKNQEISCIYDLRSSINKPRKYLKWLDYWQPRKPRYFARWQHIGNYVHLLERQR